MRRNTSIGKVSKTTAWQGRVSARVGIAVLCLMLMFLVETPGGEPGTPGKRAPWAGKNLTGKVVRIIDGDTLELLDTARKTWRIRLADIDAPEKEQPFGEKSRQSLAELVFGREVTAECPEQDHYGRQLCTVRIGRRDINREQVERGMAWVFRQFSTRSDYCRSEEIARRERYGLWRDPQPIPPWEWRKAQAARRRR